MTFDAEYRAKLGPRPPMRRGIPSPENRAWDSAYLELFPSADLPTYHPRRRKDSKAIDAEADRLIAAGKGKVRDAAA